MSTPHELPFVSVAIPTHNRAQSLERCLASLARQRYPHDRYEVVVVDDASRDATPAVVDRASRRGSAPSVRYVAHARQRGANAARNAGLRVATGDPVCFVDDDIEAPPSWLGCMVAAAAGHPTAGCLGGPIHPRLDGESPNDRERELLAGVSLDLGPDSHEVRYVWSGNMAVRRHAVAAVGPLQEHRLPGHDEVEWIDRLHRRHIPVFYVADAWVWHHCSARDIELARTLRRRFMRGVGESVAYHHVGVGYRVDAQLVGLREHLERAVRERQSTALPMAAQFAGRVAAGVPLRVWDRIRGRPDLLPPPG